MPGHALSIVSGSIMAAQAGMPMAGFNWLKLSLILLAITGIIWAVILIPMQLRMIRYSAECIESGTISKDYQDASRSWAVFGVAATLLRVRHIILYGNKRFLKGRD
ncbi:DUF2269 family protein [Bacillus sp. FJAT-27225]|uniref:DUF2269 family protein n=1 Tax=Bacillus sp. FJAT-27225 TaxID=1743144 RepID=UPI0034A0C673